MACPNLRLRGGSYYWRRKATVRGTVLTFSLPLRTGCFHQARRTAALLEARLGDLRVAYGERGSAATEAQLKRVFSDALRWQLERVRRDQLISPAPDRHHAALNAVHAEAWRFLAEHGSEARWTLDEHERLVAAGWNAEEARRVAEMLHAYSGEVVSGTQVQAYHEKFGIAASPLNAEAIKRMVLRARAAACELATGDLGGDLSRGWIEDGLTDDTPLTFEEEQPAAAAQGASPSPSAGFAPDAGTAEQHRPAAQPAAEEAAPPPVPGKPLLEAAEDCIAAHLRDGAWSEASVLQVRTALTMFDHVLGGNGLIEQVTQQHVTDFGKLCRSLPSRWDRTAEEKTGGLAASLARATQMNSADIGLSLPTIKKRATWIEKILTYAASDRGGRHRTAEPVSFKQVRAGLGSKAASRRRRDREKRVNWTKQEVAQLLAAPIWTGCLGLDDRLKPGREVYHDAWYWLPLMLPLYGGCSSELAGLPLAHVHDAEPIPFFEIEETEDRRLKNAQARRRLPIHPELTRLGFLDYVAAMRAEGQRLLFPELDSPGSGSFASTFYKSVFRPLRAWAFPNGTASRQRINGAWKDKDVHSFRGMVSTLMKGRVSDSVRVDIIGHEGETETDRTYDEEADLATKLEALKLLSPITQHLMPVSPIRLRPADRLKHGGRRGRRSGVVMP